MKFLVLSSVFCLCWLASIVDAKIFDKCSLAREMSKLGVPRDELPDYVCVAQYESSFNTAAMNTNTNKSKDWGIFQINDYWWCDPMDGRKTHNSCKIPCSDLLSNDITKAVRCAQQVKREQGFKAWVAWQKKCQKSLPSVSSCF